MFFNNYLFEGTDKLDGSFFNFSGINLADKLVGFIISILQALVIAFLTSKLITQAFEKERMMGKQLKDRGITAVKSQDGLLKKRDRGIVFGLNGNSCPQTLDLCFLTGSHFFTDFELKRKYISSLLERGCKVRILLENPNLSNFHKQFDFPSCCDLENKIMKPNSEYVEKCTCHYHEILKTNKYDTNSSFLERAYEMIIRHKCLTDEENYSDSCRDRLQSSIQQNGDHWFQCKMAETMVKNLQDKFHSFKQSENSIELRYYVDEYQMPMIICLLDNSKLNEKKDDLFVWTNLKAPSTDSMDSINMSCSSKRNDEVKIANSFLESFNYLWEKYNPKQGN